MAQLQRLMLPQEIIEIALIDKDVDVASFPDSFIEIAQEEHIFPVIGDQINADDSLYGDIVQQNNDSTLTADNAILLNDYIKNALAFYVKYEIIEDISVRLTAQGLQENFTEFGRQVTSASRADLSAKVLNHANTYRDKMVRFLEDNLDLYPKYKSGLNVTNRGTMVGGLILGDGGVSKTFVTRENER